MNPRSGCSLNCFIFIVTKKKKKINNKQLNHLNNHTILVRFTTLQIQFIYFYNYIVYNEVLLDLKARKI